jgi:H+-transporting ATPase
MPGLGGVVPAIETSRRVFQRIITYTLAMLVKKIEMMALLVVGFLVTREAPLTPLLMVLILFLNDFLTMSISTDRMTYSGRPNHWSTRGILLAAVALAGCKLVFSLGAFLYRYYALRLEPGPLQTLTFATLVVAVQGGVYLLRERRHLWDTRPGPYLVASSALGLGVTALLALGGILMAPVRPAVLLGVVGVGAAFYFGLDWMKVRLFARLDLR